MNQTKFKIGEPVPASAMHMTIGEFVLGDNGENTKSAPIKMVARSGQPIDHPYWGKVVHDLSGMTIHKDRLPIDHCHDTNVILGYLNHFDITSGDLVASGALTPTQYNSKASEIIELSKQGVPYEASINFGGDGIKIENLDENELATVNGNEIEGPAIIIRQWPLRGVAVCPYGADMNTNSEFANTKTFNIEVLNMANEATETIVDEKELTATSEAVEAPKVVEAVPVEEVLETELAAETVDTPITYSKEQVKRFSDTFGDKGIEMLLSGKSFEELQTEHIKSITKLNVELSAKLVSVRSELGMTKPVDFSESTETTKKLKSIIKIK